MYTYDDLVSDIGYLAYNGVWTGSIGKSVLGKEIFFVHLGAKEGKQIIITGGIHARENVTSALVMRQIFALCGKNIGCGFYFLPMLNPDGAMLVCKGGSAAGEYISRLVELNGGDDFSQWKANIAGVDLNNNFPAKWGEGKGNVRHPAPHGYIGKAPLSEPETRALCDFTLEVRPVFTVSYHALGREVYWYFGQKDHRDRIMASYIADYLGYKLIDGDLSSAGGYKDWCVTVGIPAVTIEIGSDTLAHPVTEEEVKSDIERNLRLPENLLRFFEAAYK